MLHAAALLDSNQIRKADRDTIEGGVPAVALMENAGRAVADCICELYDKAPTLILCGLGNNGGDGFVVARLLHERGWPVTVAIVGDERKTRGEADVAKHKLEMSGMRIVPFETRMLTHKELVVDALFGTGLNGDVENDAKKAIDAVTDSKLPVVAIDIASGIDASTGAIRGAALRAVHTVTFFRPKLGHVLLPGKEFAGQLHVFDIGIKGDTVSSDYFLNLPALWRDVFPFPGPASHKYTRGHAIVFAGGVHTAGAAKLSALGALRSGAGLVSLACPPDALPAYAASVTALMTKPVGKPAEVDALLADKHVTAICIGPGYGVGEKTRETITGILKQKKPCVLDADALTSFEGHAKALFSAISGPCVLTPHEGEFARLFADKGLKTERAVAAAKQSKSVVVFKGNDTVIAAPDGRIAINAEAPVWLATAGTGDVLAGIITGLLAQGMPAFEAACAGVWLHSRAAAMFGPGLIADDLLANIPAALKSLY